MKGFRIKPDPELERLHAEFMAAQKAYILSGRVSVKWSQACGGYRIRAGRSMVLGLETFTCESDAWEWLEETHGIKKIEVSQKRR